MGSSKCYAFSLTGSWDANGATFTCTDDAQYIEGTFTSLSGYVPECNGTTDIVGGFCAEAITSWCESQGFEGGYGPTEHNGDIAHFVCLGVP